MSQARYYPSPEKTGNLHDEWTQVYNHMHEVREFMAQHKKADPPTGGTRSTQEPGGPSNTKIGGLYVEGKPPQQGSQVSSLVSIPVLGYDKATGQIRWFIPM